MVLRVVSAALWFAAISWASNFASAFVGLPSFVGLAVAVATAAFIVVDPLNLLWPARIETVAHPSARHIDHSQVVQTVR